MATNQVKQSHYLPRRAYLSHFTEKDKIWVFNVADSKDGFTNSDPFQTSADKFGRENYIYEAPGLPKNTLEQVLQPIEDSYLGIFNNKINKQIALTKKEILEVSMFISTLEVRIPAHREHWNEQLDHLKQMGIDVSLANNSEEAAKNFASQIEQAKLGSFAQSLIVAMEINRWGFSDFCFLYIEKEQDDQYFITSDDPTCLIDYAKMNSIYGIAPTSRTLELTIPLSRKVALFINNVGINGYKPIRHNFVRDINNRTINNSRHYLISPHKMDDRFYTGVYQHYPQSLILEYLQLPKGNIDKQLTKIEKLRKKAKGI